MTCSEVEKEIVRANEEWIDAVKRQDATTLDRLIADDFLIAGDSLGEKLGDKKLYLADCLSAGPFESSSGSYEILKLRVYGNTAIVNSTFKYQVTIEGKEYGGAFLTTAVWVRNGERWQYVTCHSHRLAEEMS